MNLITVPNFNAPITKRMIPAITVAIANPSMPKFWMMPYTITMNAPVGPPICTFVPPRKETKKPPMMAVIRPFSGLTPEAIPNAMARGNATIPTMIPAIKSVMNFSFE